MVKNIFKQRKGIKEWGLALGLALILALVVKGSIIQSFKVDSLKMEKTILSGDYLMVNKLAYGARLPITLFSVPFFSHVYSDIIKFPYCRLPGFSNIKISDVLIVNYPDQLDPPIDKREIMINRCAGLPGDTVTITDKKVFVNGMELKNPAMAQFNFRLVTNGQPLDNEFMEKFGIREGGKVSDAGIYDFPLTKECAEDLKKEENIRYIRELKDFPGENTQYVFPVGHYYSYNKDNFGPVVVPFKGQTVQLNIRNIELYKSLIVDIENNTLKIDHDSIYINAILTSNYTIKNNYYFVLDDNRDYANDSRYWGFLPESHIIGKAQFIWFSFDGVKKKIRWNRVFRRIN